MSHKLSQNAEFRNFGNGVTNIQIGTLRVLLNSLSIYLLSWVKDTSGFYRMQKEWSIQLRFEETKIVKCR